MRIMVLGGKPVTEVLAKVQQDVELAAVRLGPHPDRAKLLELAGALLMARGIAERDEDAVELKVVSG